MQRNRMTDMDRANYFLEKMINESTDSTNEVVEFVRETYDKANFGEIGYGDRLYMLTHTCKKMLETTGLDQDFTNELKDIYNRANHGEIESGDANDLILDICKKFLDKYGNGGVNESNNKTGKVLSEGSLSSKAKKIIEGINDNSKFKIPASRIAIIEDIIEEFSIGKKNIQAMAEKLGQAMLSGKKNGRLYKAMESFMSLNPKLLEILSNHSDALATILDDGRTNDNSIKKLVEKIVQDLAKFSDEEIKTAIKAENELLNLVRNM